MIQLVSAFIETHCVQQPDGWVSAREFYERFRASLPANIAKAWPKWAVLAELQGTYAVGTSPEGAARIGGLVFRRQRRWVRDPSTGRLKLVEVDVAGGIAALKGDDARIGNSVDNSAKC